MKDWASLKDDTLKSVVDALRYMIRTRDEDISETENYKNIFIRGRKVGKIPTSSIDVIPTDRVGDFNYDLQYIYICVQDGSNAVWRRATLGVF